MGTFWIFYQINNQKYKNAIDGKTNIECFNYWLNELKDKIETYQAQILKIPNTSDTIKVLSVGFGITAFAHFGADLIAPAILQNAPSLSKFSLTSRFFWLIVLSTTCLLYTSDAATNREV